MQKRLTITIDEQVYEGLHKVIGRDRISRFIENVVRPYVLAEDLEVAYQQMAQDEERDGEYRHQAHAQPLHLSETESTLLQQVNLGLSQEEWGHYRELIAKRRAETLTHDEQEELIALSDRIEEANARRMESLVKLARLRETPLEVLMEQLGIKAPSHV